MKINWFSPLLPAQSGIAANYAMQVLPVLARRHEIVLWTDQEQVAPEIARIAPLKRYDAAAPPWRDIHSAAVSIYHLGNDPAFHGAIWSLARRQPGIVVLHDLCLHDFFSKNEERAGYLESLEHWYGAEGRRAGEAFLAGGITSETMVRRFPLTREAAHNALGVVTHSAGALEQLHEQPACPVATLEHPYVPAAESRYHRWLAARQSAPAPPYRLVVFGYLGRNRRLEALLEAWAGLAERDRFRLDICGHLWDETYVRGQIERLGLGSWVAQHGFLSDAEVEQRLSAAHLAVNLRNPSMGEASGTQLQFWDYGLPSLVTRTGWYATLPEGTVAFVDPDNEVLDIQAHLRAFLADPAAFRAMGERGRRRLSHHDPEKYCDALVRLAGEVSREGPRVAGLTLARRVGADCSAWLDPAAASRLLHRASGEIAALYGAK